MKIHEETHQQQLLWLVTVLFVTLSFLVPGVPSWKSHPRELPKRFAQNKHWHEKSSQGREHTDSICDLCRSKVVRRPDPAQEAAAQQWTDPAQDRDLPQLLSLAGAAASRRHAQDGTTKTHARFSA